MVSLPPDRFLIGMLSKAYGITGQVVAGMAPTQLGLPTLCEPWTVRDVLNHLVGVIEKFTAFAEDETDTPRTRHGDRLGAHPAHAYGFAVQRSAAAWSVTESAVARTCHLPFGSFDGATAAGIVLFDTLVHGWDLSQATGQRISRDPDVWSAALAVAATVVPGDARDPRHYAPALRVDESAMPDIKLLALLGRQAR